MLAYIAELCDRRRRNDFHPFGKEDGDRRWFCTLEEADVAGWRWALK